MSTIGEIQERHQREQAAPSDPNGWGGMIVAEITLAWPALEAKRDIDLVLAVHDALACGVENTGACSLLDVRVGVWISPDDGYADAMDARLAAEQWLRGKMERVVEKFGVELVEIRANEWRTGSA